MEILKYIIKDYKLVIYSIASIVISVIISSLLNSFNKITLIFKLFSIILLLLFIMRITDDIFDYDKDKGKKKQILTKKQLIITDVVCAILFVMLNLYNYHLLGLISLLLIIYILLQQKAEILKIFFMFLSSVYYLYINSNLSIFSNYLVQGYLIVCLIIPILFYCYKRSKRT